MEPLAFAIVDNGEPMKSIDKVDYLHRLHRYKIAQRSVTRARKKARDCLEAALAK